MLMWLLNVQNHNLTCAWLRKKYFSNISYVPYFQWKSSSNFLCGFQKRPYYNDSSNKVFLLLGQSLGLPAPNDQIKFIPTKYVWHWCTFQGEPFDSQYGDYQLSRVSVNRGGREGRGGRSPRQNPKMGQWHILLLCRHKNFSSTA